MHPTQEVPAFVSISRSSTLPSRSMSVWERYAELAAIDEPSFCRSVSLLLKALGPICGSAEAAALEVKRKLFASGFRYDTYTFRLEEVIASKRGNCLGLPLLAAAILLERGFEDPVLLKITNPRDAVFREETRFAERLNVGEFFPFPKPVLAEKRANHPQLRCAPFDHLGIRTGEDRAVEVTSQMRNTPAGDCAVGISFDEGIGLVLSESARRRLRAAENIEKARGELRAALDLYPGNIGAIETMRALALGTFDDASFRESSQRLASLSTRDILSIESLYRARGRQSDLAELLSRFPQHAFANAWRAQGLVLSDPAESRFQFAVASQLVAQSSTLALGDFYVQFAPALVHLFGRAVVERQLRQQARAHYRDPDYYLVQSLLLGNTGMLGEGLAAGAFSLPRQQLAFVQAAEGTEYQARAAKIMERLRRTYHDSEIFQRMSQETSF